MCADEAALKVTDEEALICCTDRHQLKGSTDGAALIIRADVLTEECCLSALLLRCQREERNADNQHFLFTLWLDSADHMLKSLCHRLFTMMSDALCLRDTAHH